MQYGVPLFQFFNRLHFFNEFVNLAIDEILSLCGAAMVAKVHGIRTHLCFTVSCLNFTWIFLHDELVKCVVVADNLQTVVFDARVLNMGEDILVFQQPFFVPGEGDVFVRIVAENDIGEDGSRLAALITALV